MLTLEEMKQIAKEENVIFYKPDCPFCISSERLMEELVQSRILSDFKIYYLNQDFSNENLTLLVKHFGWQPSGFQQFCTKPQIFIQGQYIGGNHEFYKSKWNKGENESGQIMLSVPVNTPNLKNPMPF